MATFSVLTGKALGRGIAGYGKVAGTFSEKTHQLAYSAINHVDVHHCASHLNNLWNVTPTNYRKALLDWAKEFGKVKFDDKADNGPFVYNDKAKSKLEAAMDISPAEFVKASNTTKTNFNELAAFKSLAKRLEDKGGSKKAKDLVAGAIAVLEGKATPAKAETPEAPKRAARKAKLAIVPAADTADTAADPAADKKAA